MGTALQRVLSLVCVSLQENERRGMVLVIGLLSRMEHVTCTLQLDGLVYDGQVLIP